MNDEITRRSGGASARGFAEQICTAFAGVLSRHTRATAGASADGHANGASLTNTTEPEPRLRPPHTADDRYLSGTELAGDWLSVERFNDCYFLIDDPLELAHAHFLWAPPGAGQGQEDRQ